MISFPTRRSCDIALKESVGNYAAPLKIIESVEYGFLHGFEKGLIREAELFGQLAVTPESRALVQLFFDVNGAKKNPLADEVRSVAGMAVTGDGLRGTGNSELSVDDGFTDWQKE